MSFTMMLLNRYDLTADACFMANPVEAVRLGGMVGSIEVRCQGEGRG